MQVELFKERGTRPLLCSRRLLRVLQEAQALAGLGEEPGLLHVIFSRNETIQSLNIDFVHHQGLTDVITFDFRGDCPPMMQEETCVGEIYVCAEIAVAWSAKYRQFSPSKELVLYMVHGMLHLAGEDDLNPVAKKSMRRAERRVLAALEKHHSLEGFL